MLKEYRHYLISSYILLFILYIIIVSGFYFVFKHYSIIENEKRLQDLLMHDKALQIYVSKDIKPIFYNFEKEGILSKNYFNPKVLSFTYISRHVMQNYNKLRIKHGLTPIIYKIPSDNPRNPVNTANKEELKILKEFNQKKISTFKKELNINGKKYIYYAIPVIPNQKKCMRCHTTPQKAPKDLVKMYGPVRGFHEKLGHIRAFLSIKIPLATKSMMRIFKLSTIIISFIFILIATGIFFFFKKLSQKEKKLINYSQKDSLTNIYNRVKFNEDIKILEKSQRNEDIYLIMFDIDHFKNVNDTYGHISGDNILKELAILIKSNIRNNDTFYRIGGEEFMIISKYLNKENAIKFAEKLRKLIENHSFSNPKHITISIGITKYKLNELFKQTYARVDEALYESKKKRNKVTFK